MYEAAILQMTVEIGEATGCRCQVLYRHTQLGAGLREGRCGQRGCLFNGLQSAVDIEDVEGQLAILCLLGHPESLPNSCPITPFGPRFLFLIGCVPPCALSSEGAVTVSVPLPMTSAGASTQKVVGSPLAD